MKDIYKYSIISTVLSKDNTIREMSNIFKILSDVARLKIVLALQEGELSVSELVDYTNFSQSLISHHLKILRDANLARSRRKGRRMLYSLADSHIYALLAVAHDHANETVKDDE